MTSLNQTSNELPMAKLVTIGEALQYSSYKHEHIALLLRQGKIEGRKSGSVWLVDLDSLTEYEQKMQALGTKKHTPR